MFGFHSLDLQLLPDRLGFILKLIVLTKHHHHQQKPFVRINVLELLSGE